MENSYLPCSIADCPPVWSITRLLSWRDTDPHPPIISHQTDISAKMTNFHTLLGVVQDVRTLRGKFATLAKTIWHYSQTEEGQHTFKNIRFLRERWEPEAVAKEKASRSRAKVARGAYRPQATDGSWRMPLQS